MSAESDKEYLLGSRAEEVARLRQQHEIWSSQTSRTLDLANFAKGSRVLDLGAGPGFTSLALAERVGETGQVLAVDNSARFAEILAEQAAAAERRNIRFLQVDVHELKLSVGPCDGAFARWLFCFLARPEAVIQAVATQLKAGARFAIYDYINYLSMSFHPNHPALARFFQAVHRGFAASGGSLDICDVLPHLLTRNGFQIEALEVFAEVCGSDGKYWRWFKTFRETFAPTLLTGNFLSAQELAEFDCVLAEREADPGAFLTVSPMMAVVARRL